MQNDEITGPDGKRIFAMKRAHVAVRRYYVKQTGRKLVILKLIVTILPFLIL